MQIIFLFLSFSSLSACAQHAVSHVAYKDPVNNEFKSLQQDILYYVNQHRKALGLSALQMNEAATAEAVKHSVDMARRTTGFGHEGFTERINNIRQKLGFLRASAENVAYGKIDAKEVMEMWLSSPGHKKNIEGNYSLMGIGIAKSSDGYLYFTQIFLLK